MVRPRPPPRLPRRPPAGAAVRPGAARSAGTVVESPALPPSMGYSSSAALIIWYTYFVTNPNLAVPAPRLGVHGSDACGMGRGGEGDEDRRPHGTAHGRGLERVGPGAGRVARAGDRAVGGD